MSSKTQLNEYTKILKREISELKRDNEKLTAEKISFKFQISKLKSELFHSRLRERRWYHFF